MIFTKQIQKLIKRRFGYDVIENQIKFRKAMD